MFCPVKDATNKYPRDNRIELARQTITDFKYLKIKQCPIVDTTYRSFGNTGEPTAGFISVARSVQAMKE